MIECQYCYTRNKNDAPKCESCGGPLEEKYQIEENCKPIGNTFNIHYRYIDSGNRPHPIKHPGLSPKQRELVISLFGKEVYKQLKESISY